MTWGIPPLTRDARAAGSLCPDVRPRQRPAIGLIEQQRWSRVTDTYGVKHSEKNVPVKKKKVTAGSRLRRYGRTAGGDTETGNHCL